MIPKAAVSIILFFFLHHASNNNFYSFTSAFSVGNAYRKLPKPITLTLRKNDDFVSNKVKTKSCRSSYLTSLKSKKDEEEIESLKDKAAKLRREAEEMEELMKEKRTSASPTTTTATTEVDASSAKKITYKSLDDSKWTLTYRFASEPPPKDDDADDDSKKRIFYSGKVNVGFTNDGYTNILTTDEITKIAIPKFWGWDVEVSNEDSLTYLLFSADVVLPESDPNGDVYGSTTRFYFNARVDTDEKTGDISLSDGTITLKKDVEPPGGFWGIFNGGGILAQFRYVGDFTCRPF